ncbi:MAG: type I-B CRISPR-associated protein Cas5b [Bacteroidia bacterium]|nr:type I-B CRISPR-associated protein Cas5b [Bacteroidia bacterium]
MEKLVSIDLKADFGFFRKPDANNTINLSYNIIHKPAILGVLGAVLGLEGYKEKGKLPAYYETLKDIKTGVEPLEEEKGSYRKTNIKYSNTVGYANKGSNFLTEEMTLVNPQYRIYLLLETENAWHQSLLHNLSNAQSEFIPYFGKNEFTAWWEKTSFREYSFEQNPHITESIRIKTVFQKDLVLRTNSEEVVGFLPNPDDPIPFLYFERLPKKLDANLMQYDLGEFAYSTFYVKNAGNLQNLYYIKDEDYYVQLI